MALDIEEKVDSPEKLAAIAGKPTENYLFANEVNEIVGAVKELEILVEQNSLTPENFGAFSNGLQTEDDISDSDKINYTDTSDGNKQKKTTWLNIKAKVVAVIDNLFVPKTRTLTIGAETFDLSANRTFAGGSNKRTVCFTYEFNGALNTATNNWWGAVGNGTPSILVNNASLTPANNFSSAPVQSPAWVVPFNCRLKSITFKGFSNAGAGLVDLAFSSGTYLGSGSVLVNNTILSNQPFTIHNYLGVGNSSCSLYVFDTGFTNYVIPKGYEIRMFMNNRNVAKNLLSATIIVEFEEEI